MKTKAVAALFLSVALTCLSPAQTQPVQPPDSAEKKAEADRKATEDRADAERRQDEERRIRAERDFDELLEQAKAEATAAPQKVEPVAQDMPDTSLNWLPALLGGALLTGIGVVTRRRT